MEILKAIETRKSIRAYLDKPVDKNIVDKILESAIRTPTAVNIQPWSIYAVTGEILNTIKGENVNAFLAGQKPTRPEPDIRGVFKERRRDLAMDLFELLDIKREDAEKRKEWTAQGFKYFGAPVALILTIHKDCIDGTWGLLGIGSIIQTVSLAAMEYGLDTCIGEQGIFYQDILRKYLEIPEEEDIIISISLGYADSNFPANKLIAKRAPLSEVTRWFGF